MSIIEQATKRLEELNRAGIAVPWAAANLKESDFRHAADLTRRGGLELLTPAAEDRHGAKDDAPAKRSMRRPGAAANGPRVTLDLQKIEAGGNLVPTQLRSILAEEFRQIKRPLLKNARSKAAASERLPLIMVTSAMPGEGKTFSAINLAMSIAVEIDMSVLLIDADVVRPDAMRRLGVEEERGLLDLLTNPSLRLEDVVIQTNVPKLSLLPAGRRSNLSTELLASEAMEELLVSLATEYPGQIAIFDAPPLLLTSEAKVLASRVGQVVLVVEAGGTSRSTVANAFAAVENCPIVMSVLNKSTEPQLPVGYGYYYG
jgi:receptor protein-tyrosine kinase